MPRAHWTLVRGRPAIVVILTLAQDGRRVTRNLLADTGAGTAHCGFELLLEENECVLTGGISCQPVVLGGAYAGSFPVYVVRVEIPELVQPLYSCCRRSERSGGTGRSRIFSLSEPLQLRQF
jgi:hypothetical protein